ncbi:CBS domain-containing protein [Brumimicrobium aurantiacum]|uniref:CBS domain-containing protein n=1 Tax=Brumimicrobium aurantiacum TaxID=1737063 RepID=A0A3E1EVC1_9FLAO|nr:CBS domain-containing protein [Brumimicrobium aurantiacum]RFC53490.1 CBS domain-containing protein [Brumimicrobium aurantiacum]
MIAIDLITEEIPPLKHTDTGETALLWMEEFKVNHLSVLKGDCFVGLVSEDDLLDKSDLTQTLDELFIHLPRSYAKDSSHIYEVLSIASIDRLSVIPVLDVEENYLGNISVAKLMQNIAATGSIKEAGGIIVLEMSDTDYSLTHISQIIESENAKILSSFITSKPTSKKLELTLKINQLELGRVIRALERYDFHVKASFQRDSYHDDLKDRYDELMNYLNI